MIIEEFVRDEANEIYAVIAGEKIHLTSEYVKTHKPQVGDTVVETIIAQEPVVDQEPVVETKEEAVEEVAAEESKTE